MNESQFATTNDNNLIDKTNDSKKILTSKLFENSIKALKSQTRKSKTIEEELLEINKMCSELNIDLNHKQINLSPNIHVLSRNISAINQNEKTNINSQKQNTQKYISPMNFNKKNKNMYQSSNKDQNFLIEKSLKKIYMRTPSYNIKIEKSFPQKIKIKNKKNVLNNGSNISDVNYINNQHESKDRICEKFYQSKNNRASMPANKHNPLSPSIHNKNLSTSFTNKHYSRNSSNSTINCISKCDILETNNVNSLTPEIYHLNGKTNTSIHLNTFSNINNYEQNDKDFKFTDPNNSTTRTPSLNKEDGYYEHNFNLVTMKAKDIKEDSLPSQAGFKIDINRSNFIDINASNRDKQYLPLEFPIDSKDISSLIIKQECLINTSVPQVIVNDIIGAKSALLNYLPPKIPEAAMQYSRDCIVRPVTMLNPSSPPFLPFNIQQTIRAPTFNNNTSFKNNSIENESIAFQESVKKKLSDQFTLTNSILMAKTAENNAENYKKEEFVKIMEEQNCLQNSDNLFTQQYSNCCNTSNLNILDLNNQIKYKSKKYPIYKNMNIGNSLLFKNSANTPKFKTQKSEGKKKKVPTATLR